MYRVFKTRYFSRWMRKIELTDQALCEAAAEMVAGLVDADLGGSVIKKRVALPGRGKRGGTRTLVATNKHDRWFFVFGFEKKERANVSARELEGLQTLTMDLLGLTERELAAQIKSGAILEICHDSEAESEKPDS